MALDLKKTPEAAKKEAGTKMILNLKKAGTAEIGRELSRKDAQSRVVLILDVSGSAEDLYKVGYMGLVATMCSGIALNLDDNGELDVLAFDGRLYSNLPPFTLANAETYIDTYIYDRNYNRGQGKWRLGGGMTHYANPLKALKNYKPGDPVYAIMLTDGENQDQAETLEALIDLSYYGPIFVQTVGVGYGLNVRFNNLKEMNELGTVNPEPGEPKGPRFMDNAGFCTVDFKSVSEAQVYDALMNEYPKFIAKSYKNNLLPWTKSPIAQRPGGGLFGRR